MKTSSQKVTKLSKKTLSDKKDKMLIGCQEWCALPKLHLPAIKAKVDTGAKTSALHASDIKPFHRQGELFVHFMVHPLQRNTLKEQLCTALVIDQRLVMNTGGQKEQRYVILTTIELGGLSWEIEVSLTNRESLAFRMLLGRDALKGHSLINPGRTFIQGRFTPTQLKALYR